MKYIAPLLVLFLCATGFTGSEKDETAINFASTITSEDLSVHLHILASDEYEGRETGKEGQKKAAKYIADHFKKLGLAPGNGDSYFQSFPLEVIDPRGVKIMAGDETYTFLEDFYYYPSFSDQVIKTDDIVFLGYGIDDVKYSDYKDVDVKGKVIVVLDGEPRNKDGKSVITRGKRMSHWSVNWRSKLETAKTNGAVAVLVVVDGIEDRMERVGRYLGQPTMKLADDKKVEDSTEASDDDEMIPAFYISEDMTDNLLAPSKNKLKKVRKKMSKSGKTMTITVDAPIEINITRNASEMSAENVLGFLEGTDKKDEIVIITAHYDHIGRDGDKIFNGADDDGSGTVAVLELAEAFAKAKAEGNGPRRSILFMPVSGEEKGLLGSEYYTNNPIYKLENTVCDLNIDMIGRIDEKHDDGDYVYLIGSDKLSTELHEISEKANGLYTQLELDYTFNADDDPNRFYYRSDHYNFAKNDIPVIFYFNGTHADYHKETDTVEKINFEKMEKITRLVFHTAWELANREERIKVDKPTEEE